MYNRVTVTSLHLSFVPRAPAFGALKRRAPAARPVPETFGSCRRAARGPGLPSSNPHGTHLCWATQVPTKIVSETSANLLYFVTLHNVGGTSRNHKCRSFSGSASNIVHNVSEWYTCLAYGQEATSLCRLPEEPSIILLLIDFRQNIAAQNIHRVRVFSTSKAHINPIVPHSRNRESQ